MRLCLCEGIMCSVRREAAENMKVETRLRIAKAASLQAHVALVIDSAL